MLSPAKDSPKTSVFTWDSVTTDRSIWESAQMRSVLGSDNNSVDYSVELWNALLLYLPTARFSLVSPADFTTNHVLSSPLQQRQDGILLRLPRM